MTRKKGQQKGQGQEGANENGRALVGEGRALCPPILLGEALLFRIGWCWNSNYVQYY